MPVRLLTGAVEALDEQRLMLLDPRRNPVSETALSTILIRARRRALRGTTPLTRPMERSPSQFRSAVEPSSRRREAGYVFAQDLHGMSNSKGAYLRTAHDTVTSPNLIAVNLEVL